MIPGMAPFWSGIAIGLGISLALFLMLAVLFVIIYVAEWLLVIPAALYVVARDGMRVERARIDAARAKLGLPPFHRGHELLLSMRRAWRMLRHPIRERAFIAESFHAWKNPTTHKWSDGLS